MKLYTLLTVFAMLCAVKVNAQITRLVAESDYSFPGGTQTHDDSIIYSYTGNRGGTASSGYIDYTTSNYYNYNTATNNFFNGYLYQQSFDGNNNITGRITQQWDTTHLQWVNVSRLTSMYNTSNNDTLDENEEWDTTTAQWAPANLSHNIWVNNFETLNLLQLYDTTQKKFINYNQIIYAPTKAGADSFRLFQNWDGQKWYSTELDSRYYDAGGNDTSTVVQSYDTTNHVWNTFLKVTSGYGGSHKQISDCTLYWNAGLAAWDSSEREFFFYDSNMNDTITLGQDYANPGWVNDGKLVLTYNGDNQNTYLARFNWNGSSFDPVFADYYYYEIYNGINYINNTTNNVLLYPNPCADIINVVATLPEEQPVQLIMYNLAGQPVWNLNMPGAKRVEATVPVNNMAAGIYILTVKQGNTLLQKNIVVGK